jgi:ATP adenylyltransferase
METLWAPWRMTYIRGKKNKSCIFCQKLRKREDEASLVVYRGKRTLVVMNKFPYNNGHLMVVPRRHCADLGGLSPDEFQELFQVMRVSTQVLKKALCPHGFNIGFNLGKAGGAGEEHLHLHIVPRWIGDTNFMPVLGKTKIISESLNETYRKLHAAFHAMVGEGKGEERGTKT